MTYRFFKFDELKCRCGCEQALMSQIFMARLDSLREHLGFPLYVTSAYRCPEYNAKISSTGSTGPHTTGRAVDISVSGLAGYELVTAAKQFGFTGIGLKQYGPREHRFVHLDDITEGPRPTVWTYP